MKKLLLISLLLSIGTAHAQTYTPFYTKGGIRSDVQINDTTGSNGPTLKSIITELNTLQTGARSLFTPIILIGGVNSGISVSYPVSSYSVQGDTVTFNLQINMVYKGSNSGTVTVSGLPYPCIGGIRCPVNILASGIASRKGAVSAYIISDRIILSKTPESSGAEDLVYDYDMENNTTITLSGTYTKESD